MGYTTYFTGHFNISPPLEPAQVTYLNLFNSSRRMKRDPNIAATLPDPAREAVGLPIGTEGAYFVGGAGYAGQDRDASILDYNEPPSGQPSLWCDWMISDEGLGGLEWDETEKFYNYVEWLEYLIEHFLKPWGRTLNGEVEYQGEDPADFGKIQVNDNKVTLLGEDASTSDERKYHG